jgi:hypothetical protein
MERRGEHEADTRRPRRRPERSPRGRRVARRGLRAGPRSRPTTRRRGCRASRRERRTRLPSSAAIVEMLTVWSWSPPVPTMSMASGPIANVDGRLDHRVDESRHLVGRLPFRRERRQEARDQDTFYLTLQDLDEGRSGLRAFEVGAAHEWIQDVVRERSGHQWARARGRDIRTSYS